MATFIQKILDSGGEVFAVGGMVRDELLGLATKDQDLLVRKIPQDTLVQVLEEYGRVNKVGKSFGVLKFKAFDSNIEYDISLPRKERSTGPKHKDFVVEFDPEISINEDLARRDFTLNAMAKNLEDLSIIDPFHGKEDLKKSLLRVVFPNAFMEDPLRLLRGIQFAARFELDIEEKTLSLMQRDASLIQSVSPERIALEIKKLFLARKPSLGFQLMLKVGLLKFLFPDMLKLIETPQPKRHGGNVFEHTLRVIDASRSNEDLDQPGDLEVMLAALFHDFGKAKTFRYDEKRDLNTYYGHQNVSKGIARKWMKQYKAQIMGINPQNVLELVSNHMFETKSFYGEKAIRRFIRKVGKELIFKLIDFRIADKKGGANPNSIGGVLKLKKAIEEEIAKEPPFHLRDLMINGHDLMALGVPEGRSLGIILNDLLERVLEDPSQNEENSLKEYVLRKYQDLIQ